MKKILFLFLVLFTFSCSKDDASEPAQTLKLTTDSVVEISGLDAKVIGTATPPDEISGNIGICWSEHPTPTINDFTLSAYVTGNNISRIITVDKANTLYYVRVYAQMGSEIKYGNILTFTSQASMTSVLATDILTKSAVLRAYTVGSANFDISTRGFCFNTLPNPTVSNTTTSTSGGIGHFSVSAENLQPNTTYYVRPYIQTWSSTTYYGSEFTFKTTGYTGPGGGYVAYDKGEFTNGWRYLEINLTKLHYNYPTVHNAEWGCNNSFLGQTSTAIGTGLENTDRIVSTCSSANSAARLCYNLVSNGKSDWFLPSLDEMMTIRNSLKEISVSFDDCWTSSEATTGNAFATFYNYLQSPAIYTYSSSQKNGARPVYAVRRY